MTPTNTPAAPAPAAIQPTAEYFAGQIAALEAELVRASERVAEVRGALNLVRGQRKLFFPDSGTPSAAKPANL